MIALLIIVTAVALALYASYLRIALANGKTYQAEHAGESIPLCPRCNTHHLPDPRFVRK